MMQLNTHMVILTTCELDFERTRTGRCLHPSPNQLFINMAALKPTTVLRLRSPLAVCVRSMTKGDPGSGAGQGGGTGGSVRDAGGAFGKREAAQEEQYFKRLEREQLEKMKKGLKQEVEFHKKQIKAHEEAIKRHKERIDDLD